MGQITGVVLSAPRATFDHVQLSAIISPAGDDETSDVLTAEADTYDDAYAELQQRLPAGWRMLSIRRW